MHLIKALLKLVFKWLFKLLSAVEDVGETGRNGRIRDAAPSRNGWDRRAETAAENALYQMKQAISNFEESLNRSAERISDMIDDTNEETVANISDMNDLRAELAELRADIRSMKRMMAETTGSDDKHESL